MESVDIGVESKDVRMGEVGGDIDMSLSGISIGFSASKSGTSGVFKSRTKVLMIDVKFMGCVEGERQLQEGKEIRQVEKFKHNEGLL